MADTETKKEEKTETKMEVSSEEVKADVKSEEKSEVKEEKTETSEKKTEVKDEKTEQSAEATITEDVKTEAKKEETKAEVKAEEPEKKAEPSDLEKKIIKQMEVSTCILIFEGFFHSKEGFSLHVRIFFQISHLYSYFYILFLMHFKGSFFFFLLLFGPKQYFQVLPHCTSLYQRCLTKSYTTVKSRL